MHEGRDFRKKKAGLREHPRYARMLSALAYRKFFYLLAARAALSLMRITMDNPA